MRKRSTLYVCLFAVALACSVQAATVTVTIDGTATGYDYNGVFFPGETYPYAFPANTSYELVFTFNDALGTDSVVNCSGTPCASSVSGTGANSPGTAVLTINGNSFTFGAIPRSGLTSSASGSIPAHGYDEVTYSAGDSGSSVNISGIYAVGSGNVFGNTYDWRSPITTTTSESHTTYYTGTINESGGARATAYLYISQFSVNGPACDIPISETTHFDSWATYWNAAGFYMTMNDLSGSTSSFYGKGIKEFPGGTGDDACYDGYTNGTPTVDPFTAITGGTWDISLLNETATDDYIGYGTGQISFYRTAATNGYEMLQCGTHIYQQMKMYCSADSTYWPYGSTNTGNINTLNPIIVDQTHLQTWRAGVESSLQNH